MTMTENIEKRIKKHIYGKPQKAIITFPAGFGETALNEVKFILENLWFPQKYVSECALLKNEIHLENIHVFALTELLMRSRCISDIRLIIFEGKTVGKSGFEKKCSAINWEFYLNKSLSLKIKVDSVASRAFHETALKLMLTNIIQDYVSAVVSGENTQETTCIYADLYKDRLTLSISLAGDPLYKRGYRGTLSQSAPLREDAAACCIQKSLQFAKVTPDIVLIPFSGTGTFAFEYILSEPQLSPVLLGREYALQKLTFFNKENFNYLVKKAKEACLLFKKPIDIYCIDNAKAANTALTENSQKFNSAMQSEIHIHQSSDDFFEMDMRNIELSGTVFIPLNPPYGIRLNKNTDTVLLYKKIAVKINEFSKSINRTIVGFILCPNEETWSAFCKQLLYSKMETYHFTQGGIDIRVCQFVIKVSS